MKSFKIEKDGVLVAHWMTGSHVYQIPATLMLPSVKSAFESYAGIKLDDDHCLSITDLLATDLPTSDGYCVYEGEVDPVSGTIDYKQLHHEVSLKVFNVRFMRAHMADLFGVHGSDNLLKTFFTGELT